MSKTLLLFLPEMYYVIWELKKKKTKQNKTTDKKENNTSKNAQRNTQQRTYDRPIRRRRTGSPGKAHPNRGQVSCVSWVEVFERNQEREIC